VRLPLVLDDVVVGHVCVDLQAVRGAVTAQGRRITADRIVALVRAALRQGALDGALARAVEDAVFTAGRRRLQVAERQRLIRKTLAALEGPWGRHGEVPDEQEYPVDTEPWPALALSYVRAGVRAMLAHGTATEQARLVAVLRPYRRRKRGERGAPAALAEALVLRAFVREAFATAAAPPRRTRQATPAGWPWLRRAYPELWELADAHRQTSEPLTGANARALAADLLEHVTGFTDETLARGAVTRPRRSK